MPTGPLGAPRPFAECELKYQARYNINRSIGTRLEKSHVKVNAERLIAQRIEDQVDFQKPIVQLHPAGFTLLVEVGLNDQRIVASGSRTQGLAELRGTVDNAVQESVDENAERGVGIDLPEWEISCE